mmetsp:Transcript_73608/g.157874  ORF Transcript_73608/g.157874 Transcript_73608/m.157874 type:complete len:553 (-) Transcript_73608:109-1767(-)
MGNGSSKKGLQGVTQRAESRVGKITITGRYHRLPRRLEDDYKPLSKVLGSGYNGQVHMAESKENGRKFAVKGFKLHGVSRDKKEELMTEAEIFLAMDHPHVARLVDVYESEDQLNLVMECMTGGELFKRVTERRRFSEKDAADAAWQMLLAVNYIHSHEVVHRDLKLENFLYEKEGSDYLKLIDFGFSKIWQPNTKMALSCGTLAYVAPEVLDRNYTSQCDLWSLGVTIFIVLFGYMPFSGSEDRQIRAIKDGRYTVKKEVWAKVSSGAQDFVKKLLVVSPADRLTAADALKHPWIHDREANAEQLTDVNQGVVDALTTFGQVSSFRRACMSMMAWSLTVDERAKVREAFIEMDTERNGTIKLHEFKKVLQERFHVKDADALAAFEALDTNHTEEIHYSEFLAAMVSSRIAIHDDLLKETFRRFDTDNTGFISQDNLRQVLGDSFDGKEVDQMMAEADSTQDGQISYQEWIEYLRDGDAHSGHSEAAARVIDKEIANAAKAGNERDKRIRAKTEMNVSTGFQEAPAPAPAAGSGTNQAAKPASQPGCGCSLQ